jgi:hypothetical protein
MRGRKPGKFRLKAKDKISLRQLLREGQTPARVARRAQILLGRANDQQRVVLLGETIGQNAATIWRVCKRYRQHGLQAALYDAPRSGRPRVFSQKRTSRD